MINSYLYCNGKGVGYRMAVANMEKKQLRPFDEREKLDIIYAIWTHSGTRLIYGFENGAYYFIVKGMKVQKSNAIQDDQKRKICMNFAFTADKEFQQDFVNFISGFITGYDTIVKDFAECFTFSDGMFGYDIDFDGWNNVIEECINLAYSDSAKPLVLNQNHIQCLYPEYNVDDFISQTGINEKIDKIYTGTDFEKLVKDSEDKFEPLSTKNNKAETNDDKAEANNNKTNEKTYILEKLKLYCDKAINEAVKANHKKTSELEETVASLKKAIKILIACMSVTTAGLIAEIIITIIK